MGTLTVAGDDRVSHGTVLLRDTAEFWWRVHVVKVTGSDGTGMTESLLTWEVLKDSLVGVFTPMSEKELARTELFDLRQMGSVQEHTQAFQELSFASNDLAVAEKTSLFHRRLKADILMDVQLRFPKTLDESMVFAESKKVVGGSATLARPGACIVAGASGEPARSALRWGPDAGADLHAAGVAAAQPLVAQAGARAARARPVAALAGAPVTILPVRDAPPAHGRVEAVDSHGEQLRREGRRFTCGQVGHGARDCSGNVPHRD